jgi:hypothetical protein
MPTVGGLFDIRDDSAFFGIISRTLDSYRATRTKKPEDLLLLILGLAHLREWIAPNYKRGATPRNSAERFVAMLYEDPDYQTVLLLANHAKHQRRSALPQIQARSSVEIMDERDTPIDSWLDFDEGPASSYRYGDRDLSDVFSAVATLYKERWFSLPLSERWA